MAYTITITQVSGGNLVPVTTGNYYLRISPFSSNTYTGSHIADGVWSFGDIADGVYQLWNASAQVTKWGENFIGDKTPTFTTITMEGDIALAGNDITGGASVQTDTIIETTSGGGVTIDGLKIKDGNSLEINGTTEADNDFVLKTGTQTIAGNKTYTGTATFSGNVLMGSSVSKTIQVNSSGSGDVNYPVISFTDSYLAPATDNDLVPKKYVDDTIASVNVTPFQESSNYAVVIPNGTAQSGKVYTSIQSALAKFSSSAITNQGLIYVKGSGASSNYLAPLSHASLTRDYIHLQSAGKHIGLILGVTGSSLTRIMTIENFSLFFGNQDVTTARTYVSMTFDNCIIYAYNDTTFNNCILRNCIVFHASGKKATIAGTTELYNCSFNQELTFSGSSWLRVNVTDTFSAGYTLPTDPTSA